jgi:HK97 family phage major capsid protein
VEALKRRPTFDEWRRTHPPMKGGGPTLEELVARNDEIKARLQALDLDGQGRTLTDEEREEWNNVSEEFERNEVTIEEMGKRREWVAAVSGRADSEERGAHFGVASPRSQAGREDLFDLTTIRSHFSDPGAMVVEARERAKRAISDEFHFPHPDVARGLVPEDGVRNHLNFLLETIQEEREKPGEFALHLLRYGSPVYQRAFGKAVRSVMSQGSITGLDAEESRALAVSSGSTGGYAVPITLDPTLIPTSSGTVNPLRKVARIETIVGLEYRGLTTGAVVASYAPEGTEATDNSPTLAQPDVFVERCQSFVPYSIEIGMDWNGLQAGMAKLIADAKDVVEANKFTLGAGHTNNEPSGLLTGATSTVATATSSAFALADLYSLEQNLPPRFRPLGQWFANRAVYNLVRQFGQSANQALWMALANPNMGPLGIGLENHPFLEGGNIGQKLLGYGANEVSDMTTSTTHGSSILAIGDPSYYLIVDRIGMTVELIPHLFGSNRRPTGQRGLYAYWRNTGTVVDPNAWRVLVT